MSSTYIYNRWYAYCVGRTVSVVLSQCITGQFKKTEVAVLSDQVNVSCLQKFQHFWMIILDLFFESGSTEATKIKLFICHLYFWSNNCALSVHWNWKSPFKHRWMECFHSKKGGKNLFFLHEFFKLCQIFSHHLMK